MRICKEESAHTPSLYLRGGAREKPNGDGKDSQCYTTTLQSQPGTKFVSGRFLNACL